MLSGLIYLAILIVDIIFIIEIVKGSMEIGKKVIWILVILIFPFIGALLYYLVGRK